LPREPAINSPDCARDCSRDRELPESMESRSPRPARLTD